MSNATSNNTSASRPLNKMQKMDKRLNNLRAERSEFFDYWGNLSDYCLAHRGRFLNKTSGRKIKRNTKQYNNTARIAVRTAEAGLMAGMSSPARPWFKLGAGDPDLSDFKAVKNWLHKVQSIMYRVFAASNTYNQLHPLYGEILVFGTGNMGVYEDFKNVIRCETETIGSYMLGLGEDNKVDTRYKEYNQSVGQLVKRFGYDNCTKTVKNAWDHGNIETRIDIVHAVEPNDDRDGMSPLARDKRFRSVYYERGANKRDGLFLLETGFDEFPFMSPRWDIAADEIYSEDCPGMIALGDTKGLQLGERRFYQALDKVGNPPMQGPSEMKTGRGGVPNPGETVWHSAASKGMHSIYENYRPDIKAIRGAQEITENRINEAFFKNLFQMLSADNRKQPISAREVAERHDEKLVQLGPVLERLHTELLDPLINRTFNILQKNGVLPPPPQEMVNREMSVKYISILAQAQRAIGLSSTERTIGFAAGLVEAGWTEARFKIDAQQAVDQYADDAGADPRIIRADDDAEQLAQAAAQQAAKLAQTEQQGMQIDNARNASDINKAGAENIAAQAAA